MKSIDVLELGASLVIWAILLLCLSALVFVF